MAAENGLMPEAINNSSFSPWCLPGGQESGIWMMLTGNQKPIPKGFALLQAIRVIILFKMIPLETCFDFVVYKRATSPGREWSRAWSSVQEGAFCCFRVLTKVTGYRWALQEQRGWPWWSVCCCFVSRMLVHQLFSSTSDNTWVREGWTKRASFS